MLSVLRALIDIAFITLVQKPVFSLLFFCKRKLSKKYLLLTVKVFLVANLILDHIYSVM